MSPEKTESIIEITGIDHLYLTVSDLAQSEAFYDPLMKLLGFRKRSGPLAGGDRHVHYFNRVTQLTIRPAGERTGPHERMRPGLNHVCYRVPDSRQVDAAAAALKGLGISFTPPQLYPEYAPDYYAVFFTDPDGICLEITNHRQERKDIVARWDSIPWEKS